MELPGARAPEKRTIRVLTLPEPPFMRKASGLAIFVGGHVVQSTPPQSRQCFENSSVGFQGPSRCTPGERCDTQGSLGPFLSPKLDPHRFSKLEALKGKTVAVHLGSIGCMQPFRVGLPASASRKSAPLRRALSSCLFHTGRTEMEPCKSRLRHAMGPEGSGNETCGLVMSAIFRQACT